MSDETKTTAPAALAEMAEQRDEARQEAAAQEAQRILQELNEAPESSAPAPASEPSDADARKAHEEAEAKRRADWEAKQQAREDEIQFAWERAVELSDQELTEASVKRLGDMTERLTQRNMKICVTESIQTLCYEDMDFARMVMHPRKSMMNCFKYINRKALEYLKEEMKNSGEKTQGVQMVGGDIPDGLCYQWAEEYFRDMDAQEDKTDEDKAFVPKPYTGKTTAKKKTDKKPAAKKSVPKASEKSAPAPKPADDPTAENGEPDQMALF